VPHFIDCGLVFDGIVTFPVGINQLSAFEDANNVGVYVYEWRGMHAVLVHQPKKARNRKDECVLLLHNEHWHLVTNVRVFLAAERQKHQFFCYRCLRVFWNEEELDRHLELTSPNSCLEEIRGGDKTLKEYRLPEVGKNRLKFDKFETALEVPIVVYADIETRTQKSWKVF